MANKCKTCGRKMAVVDTRMTGVQRIRKYRCQSCYQEGRASEPVFTLEEPCTEFTFKKIFYEWDMKERYGKSN